MEHINLVCTVGICLCKQVSTTVEHISVLCGGYTCGARHTNATNNINLYYYFNKGN